MKKVLAAVLAGLLAWDLWLTYQLNESAEQQSDIRLTVVENTVNGYTTDITKVVEASYPMMVTVIDGAHTTSGLIYRQEQDDVYIITTAANRDETTVFTVRFDNEVEVPATLIGYDVNTDICVLAVQPSFQVPVVTMTLSDQVSDGEYTVAMSAKRPMDAGFLNFGIVSSNMLNRSSESGSWLTDVFTLERNSQAAAEGGVLLNLSGEVMGMISSRLSSANNGIMSAVVSNELVSVGDQLIEQGFVTRSDFGILGINVSNMSVYQKSMRNLSLDVSEGVYVQQVFEDGIALQNGIQIGDIVISVNGTKIDTVDDLRQFSYTAVQGTEAIVHLIREGAEIEVTVVL